MNLANTKSNGNIAIISSCTEDWGGSEELWGKSVPILISKGFTVTVYKSRINKDHPEFLKLAKMGVLFQEIDEQLSFLHRNLKKISNKMQQVRGYNKPFSFTNNPWVNRLTNLLNKNKHAGAIISQGINFDGLGYGYSCSQVRLPFVTIAQKAVDFYWPSRADRATMTSVMKEAKACYFVSQHNLELTEEQFGLRLTNGHVIFNPQKVGRIQPYPDTSQGFKLACVGRLFLLDKGQDILIRILSSDKWKNRPLHVTFVGSGVDDEGLKEMAALLKVKSISFSGHVKDIEALWSDYHALILPSRSEGLPLSLVEAMAAGRVSIISNAGGNTELITEDETAFSGYPNESDFEKAMDRAWDRRDEWENMGRTAARQIATVVPQSPENVFVEHFLASLDDRK